MKKFLCLLTCLLLVFTLTGCGSNEKENNNNNKTEEKKEEETKEKTKEETKKQNQKATVTCTGGVPWDEAFGEIEDALCSDVAEFDESGKMVKYYASLEVELTKTDKDLVEKYRDKANERCDNSKDGKYKTCNTTVDGKKIVNKAEYNLNYEEIKKLPTQQEFIEEQEEFGMLCTVEK